MAITTPSANYMYCTSITPCSGVSYSVGRLLAAWNSSSITSFSSYTPLIGYVAATTQKTAGAQYALSYTYSLAGSLLTESYPSGRVITTSYDGANGVMGITRSLNNQSKTYTQSLVYWPNGTEYTVAYGNGLDLAYCLDNRLRISQYSAGMSASPGSSSSTPTSTTTCTSGSAMLHSIAYSWAPNGNLSAETIRSGSQVTYSALNSITQTFQYDNVNRLISMTDNGGGSSTESFNYDQFGNMGVSVAGTLPVSAAMPGATVTYTSANQLPSSTGAAYDAAGNETIIPGLHSGTSSVQYDAENRQVAFESNSAYNYDGDDHRVETVTSSGTTSTMFLAV